MKIYIRLIIIFLFLIFNKVNLCQSTVDILPVTDGPVYSIVNNGNTIYIGGSFAYVGPFTGGGVPLNISDGTAISGFPKVNGSVNTIIQDGSGGWYIGGTFNKVGATTLNNIAHINSDLSVDQSWNPNVNNTVYALALLNSTIYVGGFFSSIGDSARHNIGAIDISNGIPTAWNPNANFAVNTLAILNTTIYVGGNFTSIGDSARNRLAAFDISSSFATGWNPNSNGSVFSLAISGTIIYAGGGFSTIGNNFRNALAAIDAATGMATSWNPSVEQTVSGGDEVNSIAVSGSTIYIGGEFNSIYNSATFSRQYRNNIAAIDAVTGYPTGWDPNADNSISTIAISGSLIYVGGKFNNIGGQTRKNLAAIDLTTGNATSWTNNTNNNTNGANPINILTISGSTVYVGGTFTMIGAQTRNNIAAIDASSGNLTNWNPNVNDVVKTLAISGSIIYAGGNFTNVGNQTRNHLVAIDAANGNATTWNPNANNVVNTLAISGSTIYTGGVFTSIGVLTRNHIAAIDAATGLALVWDPNADNTVNSITFSGSTVYAGGTFTNIGGQTRNYLAAIDATGNATSWNPNPDGEILVLVTASSLLYVGGSFQSIGGSGGLFYCAALDISSGNIASWAPYSHGDVDCFAVSSSTIYVGGHFDYFGYGEPARGYIAATNYQSNSATSWNPNANNWVYSISIDYTNHRIYVGGIFTQINNGPISYFAGLTNPDDPLPVELSSFTASINNQSVELKWNTATEVNNYGFEVERLRDSKIAGLQNWEKIGFVKGSGNSNSLKEYSFVDNNSLSGKVDYRLKQIDNDGEFKYSNIVEVSLSAPTKFSLEQNYPNPFNPGTTIKYSIAKDSFVTMKLYNIVGEEVATLVNEEKPAGYYQIKFDASNLASGVYFYTLSTGNFRETKKLVLLK